MSQFTEDQLKEVKRNSEGQVVINKDIIAAQVEAGWKKDVLAKHYELPASSITSILKTLGLKIRKFHKPAFVIDGVDSPAVTQVSETDSPTEENTKQVEEVVEQKPKEEKKSKSKKETVKEETPATERPIFNVSFFTQKVSALNKEEEIKEGSEDVKNAEKIEESNVPDFINTWQSWLKIDRTKEETKEKIEISITEIKNKVIENFIEKEPRISKLKEESDFVIKERNDDISHLMTETLANLYIEQKLYAKAIKAFGILSEKHPDKKSYFNDKIKEVKELRQNK